MNQLIANILIAKLLNVKEKIAKKTQNVKMIHAFLKYAMEKTVKL